MSFQAIELEPFEPSPRAVQGLFATCSTEQQRQRDILLGGQLRHELAELEHNAEAITPQPQAVLSLLATTARL